MYSYKGAGRGHGNKSTAKTGHGKEREDNSITKIGRSCCRTYDSSITNQLPKSLLVFIDNWKELTESKPFNIVIMDEYSELDHGKTMNTTYLNIANQTEDALKKRHECHHNKYLPPFAFRYSNIENIRTYNRAAGL